MLTSILFTSSLRTNRCKSKRWSKRKRPRQSVSQLLKLSKQPEGSLYLDPTAINSFYNSDPAVVTYSIAGPKGTGKTLLIRLLCGYIKESGILNLKPADSIKHFKARLECGGFEFTGDSETEGIICWNERLLFRCQEIFPNPVIYTFMVDTQGTVETETRQQDLIKDLCPALSHWHIYNVKGGFTDEEVVRQFKTFISVGHQLKEITCPPPFKKLLFVVRDWIGPDYGFSSGHDYITSVLDKYTLEGLQLAFEEVNCFTFPNISKTPVDPNEGLKALDQDFVKEFFAMAEYISADVLFRNEIDYNWLKGKNYCSRMFHYASMLRETPNKVVDEYIMEGIKNQYCIYCEDAFRKYCIYMKENFESNIAAESDFDAVHKKIVTMACQSIDSLMEKDHLLDKHFHSRREDCLRRIELRKRDYKKMYEPLLIEHQRKMASKQGKEFQDAVDLYKKLLSKAQRMWLDDIDFDVKEREAREEAISSFINSFTAKERSLVSFTKNLAELEDELKLRKKESVASRKDFYVEVHKRFKILSQVSAEKYEEEMSSNCVHWIDSHKFESYHGTSSTTAFQHFIEVTEDMRMLPVFSEYLDGLQNNIDLLKKSFLRRNTKFEKEFRAKYDKKRNEILENYSKYLLENFQKFTTYEKYSSAEAYAAQVARQDWHESCKFGHETVEMFNIYFAKLMNQDLPKQKEQLWEEIQLLVADEKEINILVLECMEQYRIAIKDDLKGNEMLLKNAHAKGVKSAKAVMTESQHWKDENTRSNVEKKLDARLGEESEFLDTFFKNKVEIKLLKATKQISMKYEEMMDRGFPDVDTMEMFDTLHEKSAASAMQKSSISKKVIKDNPDIKKSLRLCRERFRQMFEMKMAMKSLSSNINNFQNHKKGGNVTMLSFLSPTDLLCPPNHVLGKGRTSIVHSAYHKLHGEVAVKSTDMAGTQKDLERRLATITRTVELLNINNHSNIVRVIGYTFWKGRIGTVMERMDGGSLKTFLISKRNGTYLVPHIPTSLKLRFSADIATALAFLSTTTRLNVCAPRIDDVMLTSDYRCKVSVFKYSNIDRDGTDGVISSSLLGDMISVVLSRKLKVDGSKGKPQQDPNPGKEDAKMVGELEDVVELCMGRSDLVECRDTLLKMCLQAGDIAQDIAAITRQSPNVRNSLKDQKLVPIFCAQSQ